MNKKGDIRLVNRLADKTVLRVCVSVLLLTFVLFFLSGCEMFERYPYETVNIPPEKLDRIEKLDLEAMAKTQEDSGQKEKNKTTPQPEKQRELSIENCRAMALKNNLDLKVQVYVVPMADEALRHAEADFEPLAFSRMNFIKTDSPTSLTLDATKQQFFSSNIGVEFPFRS